jgi:hypothetical protein
VVKAKAQIGYGKRYQQLAGTGFHQAVANLPYDTVLPLSIRCRCTDWNCLARSPMPLTRSTSRRIGTDMSVIRAGGKIDIAIEPYHLHRASRAIVGVRLSGWERAVINNIGMPKQRAPQR